MHASMCIYIYIYTCIQTYNIQTYNIQTYKHTIIHIQSYTYTHTYKHTHTLRSSEFRLSTLSDPGSDVPEH